MRNPGKLRLPPLFFQGEGWGGVCFLACETSIATPSQPPPWQGKELFEAFFRHLSYQSTNDVYKRQELHRAVVAGG